MLYLPLPYDQGRRTFFFTLPVPSSAQPPPRLLISCADINTYYRGYFFVLLLLSPSSVSLHTLQISYNFRTQRQLHFNGAAAADVGGQVKSRLNGYNYSRMRMPQMSILYLRMANCNLFWFYCQIPPGRHVYIYNYTRSEIQFAITKVQRQLHCVLYVWRPSTFLS